MKRWLWIAPLLLLSASAVYAQEDKGSVERLVRDQRTIRSRLEKLQAKMERLAGRLKQENKPSGDLLSAALAEIEQSGVKSRMDEVVPDLTAGRFGSVDRQDEVMKDLERVYSILLARKDLDQLEEQLAQVRDALRKLGNLQTMQHDLTQQTAATSQAEQALVKKALEAATELMKKQQELLAATEKQAQPSQKGDPEGDPKDATSSIAEMKRALDQLAARQAALEKRTRAALEGKAGDVKKQLDEAAQAERSALARANSETPASDPGTAKPLTGSEKEGFVADQRRAEDALSGIESASAPQNPGGENPERPQNAEGAPEPALPKPVTDAIAEAQAKAKAARDAAEQGERDSAKRSASEALAAIEKARTELDRSLEASPRPAPTGAAAEQEAIAKEAEQLAQALERAAREGSAKSSETPEQSGQPAESGANSEPSVAEAAREQKAAAEAAKRAGEQLASKDASEAPGAQEQALERMNAARAALEALSKSERARSEQLAAKQNYLEGRARELKEMLARWNPKASGEQNAAESARQHAESTRESMSSAAQKLQSGQSSESKGDQRRAIEELAKLQDELAKQRDSAPQPDANADREKLKDLSQRQADLENKARDLMDRLKKMKDRKDSGSMEQAAGRMNQAQQELEEEDGAEAVPKQEEAEKYLDKARQELEEQEQRYQNLRQEELLFRVKDSLTKLRAAQSDLLAKTGEVELERAQRGGQLSRSARSRVRDLSNEQRALKGQNDEVAKKIVEDGALVFSFLFERNSEDLGRAADLLGNRPNLTDESTQSVQRDVIERYDEMLVTMTDEMDRRRKAAEQAPDQQPGQNQPTQKKLIPEVAELLMVKRLEEGAMRRIDAFSRSLPEPGADGGAELDESARDRLRRLGHQHSSITELFKQLVESAGAQPAPADDAKEDGR